MNWLYYFVQKSMRLLPTWRKILSVVLALFLSACASLQKGLDDEPVGEPVESPSQHQLAPTATTMISPELLREDLSVLYQRLIDIHPQPFARYSKNEFEEDFQKLISQVQYPMTRGEFYTLSMPLLVKLKDVHTHIQLPKDYKGNYRRSEELLFPLAVIWESDNLYVAADLSATPRVQTGSVIQSIDGTPVSQLIKQMRTLTNKETKSGQNRRIQMDFARLLAVIGKGRKVYQVDYLFNNNLSSIQIEGIAKPAKNQQNSKPISYYGYSRLTENTSLLWLNDFNESPEAFEDYLNKKFAEMEKYRVENLILDLRYNSGGLSENLKTLLSRITDKPIYWAEKGQIKVSTHLQRHHRAATRHRREDKLSWGFKWLPMEWTNQLQRSIWWADPGELIDLELEPVNPARSNNLKGVWVLTNGFCYSACSFFVASVNHYGLAKTVGETPGSLAEFQFAYPIVVELPHTKLKLNLPSMRLDFPSSTIGSLIQPKLEVSRSSSDIRNRRDAILNAALKEAEANF